MSSKNITDLTCELPQFEWIPDNVTFQYTSLIRKVHDSPRFGYSSDIEYLLTGTEEQARDYLRGVLACSLAIGVFFVVWALVIIVLRCLGPNRVGFLSGKLPQIANPDLSHLGWSDVGSEEQSNQLVQWEKRQRVRKRNLLASRVVVLFCSLGIVISAIVMITLGAKNLQRSVSTTFDALDKTQGNINEAISIIDEYMSLQSEIISSMTEFLVAVNEACLNQTDQICSNLRNMSDPQCDFTGIPYMDEFNSTLNSSKLYIIDDLKSYKNDLEETNQLITDIEATLKNFSWAFIVAAVFAGLLAALNLLISYGVISAWRGSRDSCVKTTSRIIRSWVLIPIFGMLVFISWIFSMVFVIGSLMSADTCYDNPDNLMTTLLVENEDLSSSFVTKAVVFYIRGCPVHKLGRDDELNELIVLSNAIRTLFENVANLAAEMASESTSVIFEEACGGSPNILATAATTFAIFLCSLGKTLVTVQQFFACDNWRPLYTLIVYDALCYQGNEGLTAVSATQFCIVLLSMVMFTMRAAFIEVREDDKVLSDEIAHGPEQIVAAEPSPESEDVMEAMNDDAHVVEEPSPEAHGPEQSVAAEPSPESEDVMEAIHDDAHTAEEPSPKSEDARQARNDDTYVEGPRKTSGGT